MCVCVCVCAKSPQSCPTLRDPIDGSPPGSAVPGILQARTLEWGAIAFSKYIYIYIYIERERERERERASERT